MEAEGLKFIFDNWMSSFMLVLARVLGFAHIGPVLSRTSVPVLVRLGVSLALAVIMSPLIKAAPNDYLSYNFFLSLFLNILAGLFIGFLTRLVVDVVQVTGEVLDNEMGLNSVSLFDPNLGQVTSLSLFFETFGTVLFIWIGGFEITLITFLKSFEIFPLVASDFSSFQISMPTVLSLTNNVVTLGIIGASPIIIVILFMDIVLGLMSRAAQQINPFSLSFSLKPLVGVLVMLLTFPYFKERIIRVMMQGAEIF